VDLDYTGLDSPTLLWLVVSIGFRHGTPYGKHVGETVPGEKRKIGIAACRDDEERRARAG